MDDCLFCKIINGEIAANKIAEDDNFLAFLDIKPFTPGHALVIPKNHFRWVYDLPNFGELWEFTKLVSQKIQTTLKPEFISYVTMGKEVPHAHIHILPRYPQDSLIGLYKEELRLKPSPEELRAVAEKINQI